MIVQLKSPVTVTAKDGTSLTFSIGAYGNYSSRRDGARMIHTLKLWDARFQMHLVHTQMTDLTSPPVWI